MKLRGKNDSWCYTTSGSTVRQKARRLSHKRHRVDDRKVTDNESALQTEDEEDL